MPQDAFPGPSIETLNSIPPEAFKLIPFEAPPPGVVPNFEHPSTRVPVILGVSIAFLVIATLCLSIRIYTKLYIAKKWIWDDTLLVLGFVFSIVYFSSIAIGCRDGALGRNGWEVHLDRVFGQGGLIQNFVCALTTYPALGLIKMSVFIQYYNLFGIKKYVRCSVYTVGTLTAAFYVPVSIAAFVMCSPWPGESLLEFTMSWHFLKFSKVSISAGVIGMLVDWTLFILPIPAIWSLHVDGRKKLGIMLVFVTGALAVGGSMISLYYRVMLQNSPADTGWKAGYTLLWTQVEMWAGVTASCMPSVKQFFYRYGPSVSQSTTLNLPHFSLRRSRQGRMPDAERGFRQWGYKSNAETESTTRIKHGSADPEMEKVNSKSTYSQQSRP